MARRHARLSRRGTDRHRLALLLLLLVLCGAGGLAAALGLTSVTSDARAAALACTDTTNCQTVTGPTVTVTQTGPTTTVTQTGPTTTQTVTTTTTETVPTTVTTTAYGTHVVTETVTVTTAKTKTVTVPAPSTLSAASSPSGSQAAPTGPVFRVSVRGTVECTSHPVEGVLVESSGGGSGRASFKRKKKHARIATYVKQVHSHLPTKIRLHVGCGGTVKKWWSDNRTRPKAINAVSVLNAHCREGVKKPAAGDNKRCTWGLKLKKRR